MGTHTFSVESDARLEGFAAALFLAAAVTSVIAFFPPEGRVMVPLHDGLHGLLGGATFVVPLGFALGGVLAIAHRARPELAMPKRRFAGLALLTLVLLAGQSLLGQTPGVVGEWVTTWLRGLIGLPLTVMLMVIVLAFGTGLALEVDPRRLIWFAKS